jgi:hypothetical protein
MPSVMLDPKEQRAYEAMRERTRRDYLSLERKLAAELADVKERIAGLRVQMDSLLKIYEGICERLGVENDLAPGGDDDGADGEDY